MDRVDLITKEKNIISEATGLSVLNEGKKRILKYLRIILSELEKKNKL